MKLLKIIIKNYKLLDNEFTLELTPTGKKNIEDKEFELIEIAPNLYTFATMAIIGKNASGKTTALEALSIAYDILSNFKIKNNLTHIKNNNKPVHIEIYFYHNAYLYYYTTDLEYEFSNDIVIFKNEKLYNSMYYKSYSKDIFNLNKYQEIKFEKFLPSDTSIIYNILNKIQMRGLYYFSDLEIVNALDQIIELYDAFKNPNLFSKVISLLDDHIKDIKKDNNNKFTVIFNDNTKITKTKSDLFYMLSSGTIKGIYLYIQILTSLMSGADVLVDEIEIHFQRTIIDNIISLFKDKKINKHNSTLIFSTHYPELLDLTNRTDNIIILKQDNKKIIAEKMHDYNLRSDTIKSKKVYENHFNTLVNYEALMTLKKEILKSYDQI